MSRPSHICSLWALAIASWSTLLEAVVPPSANASPVAVTITGEYDISFSNYLTLTITNGEPFPICLTEDDLRPGGGTLVMDATGEVISSHDNRAMATLRNINVAGPLIVVRSGRNYLHFLDLSEFRPREQSLIVQVVIETFRCSDLFQDGENDVRTFATVAMFELRDGRIHPRQDLQPVGLRPPPEPSPR